MRRALFAFYLLSLATTATAETALQSMAPSSNLQVEAVTRQLQGAGGEEVEQATLERIGSLSTSDRASIARRLGNDPSQASRLAPVLVMMLRDPSTFVRAQAAASLARLGDAAFPPMREALEADQAISESVYAEADYAPLRWVRDYLSWAFANSAADPGPILIAWSKERVADTEGGGGADALQFVSITLGARGEKSLAHARALLSSKDINDRRLGLLLVQEMGQGAAPLARMVARLAATSDPDMAADAISALNQLGDAGQAELARLFAEPNLSDVRYDIAYLLKPGPASLAAQLRVARWRDSEARELAIDGLLEQSLFPPGAVPILLEAAGETSTRERALRALGRSPLNQRQALRVRQLAEAELDRVLADEESYWWPDGAILALGNTGPAGLVSLGRRLSDAQTRMRTCRFVRGAGDAKGDDPDSPESQALIKVNELSTRLCADLSAYNADEEEARELAALRSSIGSSVEKVPEVFLSNNASSWVRRSGCSELDLSDQNRADLANQMQSMEWHDLADLAQICSRLFDGPVTFALVSRMNAEGEQFIRWASDHEDSLSDLLNAMSPGGTAQSLSWTGELVRVARAAPDVVRLWAVKRLAELPLSQSIIGALRQALHDSNREVAEAAAESLLQHEPGSEEWSEAAEVATFLGLEREVENYIDESGITYAEAGGPESITLESATVAVAAPPLASLPSRPSMPAISPPPPPPPPPPAPERDGPSDIITTASRPSRLPSFPWPPPRYTSIVTFGRDADRALLGKPQDDLKRVHDRLVSALAAIDPGFESGLFAVPGGFVLLTRLEQTQEDGQPLRGRDRWRDVRPPPSSATDFLVRLFLAPPGYYRTIAFLFTDQANFTPGTAQLPRFEQGGTILPNSVGSITYGSRNAFALIYAFRKRDTGIAQPYRLVSGQQHLQRSGLMRALQRR